jgi:hypothetical protein
VRLSFGRFWAFLTSPQYHRIHHAGADGFIDRNFAATSPFIDVIFGTCHKPKPGEFPASGLREGRCPPGFSIWSSGRAAAKLRQVTARFYSSSHCPVFGIGRVHDLIEGVFAGLARILQRLRCAPAALSPGCGIGTL